MGPDPEGLCVLTKELEFYPESDGRHSYCTGFLKIKWDHTCGNVSVSQVLWRKWESFWRHCVGVKVWSAIHYCSLIASLCFPHVSPISSHLLLPLLWLQLEMSSLPYSPYGNLLIPSSASEMTLISRSLLETNRQNELCLLCIASSSAAPCICLYFILPRTRVHCFIFTYSFSLCFLSAKCEYCSSLVLKTGFLHLVPEPQVLVAQFNKSEVY